MSSSNQEDNVFKEIFKSEIDKPYDFFINNNSTGDKLSINFNHKYLITNGYLNKIEDEQWKNGEAVYNKELNRNNPIILIEGNKEEKYNELCSNSHYEFSNAFACNFCTLLMERQTIFGLLMNYPRTFFCNYEAIDDLDVSKDKSSLPFIRDYDKIILFKISHNESMIIDLFLCNYRTSEPKEIPMECVVSKLTINKNEDFNSGNMIIKVKEMLSKVIKCCFMDDIDNIRFTFKGIQMINKNTSNAGQILLNTCSLLSVSSKIKDIVVLDKKIEEDKKPLFSVSVGMSVDINVSSDQQKLDLPRPFMTLDKLTEGFKLLNTSTDDSLLLNGTKMPKTYVTF